MSDEKKETKMDLLSMVEIISKALHEKNQHFVLRTETDIVGAFYPAEQSKTISEIMKKINQMEKRLSKLESSSERDVLYQNTFDNRALPVSGDKEDVSESRRS